MNPSAPPRLLVPGLGCLALAAFASTLGGGFLGDDFVYLARFAALPWTDWPALFVREWSEGVWGFPLRELRPFAALSFMLEARLWGAHPLGYRLVNLALLAASAGLVAHLAWRYSGGRRLAAAGAGAAFVLSPVQAEPTAWITGRVDLLAVAAFLAFWAGAERYVDTGRRRTLALASAALGVAIFSKELGLLAVPLLVLSWLLLPRTAPASARRRAAVLAAAGLVLAGYATCRQAAFGSGVATPNATWNSTGAWNRQAAYAGWIAGTLPYRRQLEWLEPPAPERVRQGLLLAAAGVVAAAGWARVRRHPRTAAVVFFGGGWWLGTVVPLLVVGYFSPRHLHLASAGLAVAAGVALSALPGSALRFAAVAALLAWLGLAQQRTLDDWRRAGDLSRQGLGILRTELRTAPPGSVVLLSAPPQWNVAWLWAWSAPPAALAPFTDRTPADTPVFAAPDAFQFPDAWTERVARPLPAALAAAPAAVAVEIAPDSRVRGRTLRGAELEAARAALAGPAAAGLDAAAWHAWMQVLLPR